MSDDVQKHKLSSAEIEAREQKTRAARIANLQDPQARQAIADIKKERAAKIAEIRQQQKENFDKHVNQALEGRKLSRNSAQLTPPGMAPSPILTEQSKAVHRQQLEAQRRASDNAYLKSQEKQYNQRIDAILDKAQVTARHQEPVPLMVQDKQAGKPEPLTSFVQTLPERQASTDFHLQRIEQRRGQVALDEIGKSMRDGKPLNAEDVKQLPRQDIEQIKSKGDEHLRAAVQERQQAHAQFRGKEQERER